MSFAQRWLLSAAKDARDYFQAKCDGTIGVTFKGGESNSHIFIGRTLQAAIEAFEAEMRDASELPKT